MQPLARLREWAELLGWRGLLLTHHEFAEGHIFWYETTDRKFHLQINPDPQGQLRDYAATVIATRYHFPLRAVGFHRFCLDDDLRITSQELYPRLAREHYRDPQWRKRFRVTLKTNE